jgi:predicted DNA-binding transcriptional regulator YafY
MQRESPLVRQWVLSRTLCARRNGATVKELAEELEVADKTVRCDLESFQRAGFPLHETVGEHGRLAFAYDEATTFCLGLGHGTCWRNVNHV